MKAEYTFNHDAFGLFVFAARETKRSLSQRDAAAEAGVTHIVFSRAEAKQSVSVPNFLALCKWMGANPYWFLTDPKTGKPVASPPPAEPDLPPGPGASVHRDQRRMDA